MALIDACSEECLKSELEIFALPPTQASVEETRVEIFDPLTSLDRAGPVHFKVQAGEDCYIDTNEIFLYFKARILDNKGDVLTEKDAGDNDRDEALVFPVNYFLASCFKNVEVTLNSQPVGGNTGLYPYRAYLQALLSYSPSIKNTILKCGLYNEDKGNFESVEPMKQNGPKNAGAKWRYEQTKLSRSFECMGRIHSEIFQQGKLLLNKVPLTIKLTRNDPDFVLMSKKERYKYRISIDGASLYVTIKKIAPHIREAHETRLLTSNARYPLKRTDIKFFSRAANISDLSEPNVVNGILPSRIVFGLVETDAFNGHLRKNPFNFQNFNLNYVAVKRNGQDIPFEPISLNFDNSECVKGYINLMHSLGFMNRNKSNGIDPFVDYKNGYTLFCVNLNQDFSQGGGHFNLQQTGNIQLILKLAKTSNKAITMVTLLEFDTVMEIDKDWNIIYNE